MPVKIRLQRHGRKKQPYYYIVVADSRSPRDGKFIERIGSYNPNTNPATIELDTDRALSWLDQGAQPTDTSRAILSYKGVLYKKHLARGVKKGALTAEEAESKFAEWLDQKAEQIHRKMEGLKESSSEETRVRLEREAKVASKRAEEIRARKRAEAEGPSTETEEVTVEEETDTAVVESIEPAVNEVAEAETPAVESEEAPVGETETPVAETGEAAVEEVETKEEAETKAKNKAESGEEEAPESKQAPESNEANEEKA